MLRNVERDHNLSGQVYRQLRDDILGGEYRPGDRLPAERELCEILGVNRSPVREALKRLEQARLVETRHGGGTVVLDYRQNGGPDLLKDLVAPGGRPNALAVRSILEARMLLAQGIIQYAARRIRKTEIKELERIVDELKSCPANARDRLYDLDFEFHYVIARSSANLAFLLILNSFRSIYFDQREFFASALPRARPYGEILEAFKKRDRNRAERLYLKLMADGSRTLKAAFDRMK